MDEFFGGFLYHPLIDTNCLIFYTMDTTKC